MNLTGKQIRATYPSVVTTGTTAGFSTGATQYLYDGKGVTSSLSLGPNGINVTGNVYVNGSLIAHATIPVTLDELVNHIQLGTLLENGYYEITDRKITVRAINSSEIDRRATRRMNVPATYTYSGSDDTHGNNWCSIFTNNSTWEAAGATLISYPEGALVIKAGQVWRKLTPDSAPVSSSIIGFDDAPGEFELVDRDNFTNFEYVERTFDIDYDLVFEDNGDGGFDFSYDWVGKQRDSWGNSIGAVSRQAWEELWGDPTPNPVDISDWGMNTDISQPMYNNDAMMVTGNVVLNGSDVPEPAVVKNNARVGLVYDNVVDTIDGNTDSMEIANNVATSIYQNKVSGSINLNRVSGAIERNSAYSLYFNTCTALSDNECPNISQVFCEPGSIERNKCTGNIESINVLGSIKNMQYPGTITHEDTYGVDIDGSKTTIIPYQNWTIRPFDRSLAYSYAGDVTITVPLGLPGYHESTHVSIGSGDLIFSSSATVNNVNGHNKSNGEYAVVGLMKVATNNFVLGGNTKA